MLSKISESTNTDLPRLFEIWESSVRATHAFLAESDIQALIPLVQTGLAHCPSIYCLRDETERPFAFLGIDNEKIEMLFVHADFRSKGAGRLLVQFALKSLKAHLVDVNEQNPLAIGFYEHLGFKVIGRSEFDSSGNPFPILHMSLA